MREQGIGDRYVRQGRRERMNVRVCWVSNLGMLFEGDKG
jgi:hypothetical protein